MADARIESLREKHARLDEEIAKEMAQPFVDDVSVASRKRLKLAIKDEIAALSGGS